jgi:hypothetical protein
MDPTSGRVARSGISIRRSEAFERAPHDSRHYVLHLEHDAGVSAVTVPSDCRGSSGLFHIFRHSGFVGLKRRV